MRIHFAYDANENQSFDVQTSTYIHDAVGRLKYDRKTSNQALVAEYRYNGLGFRVGSQTDVTNDGTTGDHDGVVPLSNHPWIGSSS